MKAHTAMTLAAAVLLTGTAPSLAATHSTMAKSPKTSSAIHALDLTKKQRKTAWNDLHGAAITVTPAPKFADRVGVEVPRSIPMKPVLSKVARAVPALKSYDFTMSKGKLLIVNPKSRKIADVISG